MSEQLRHKMIDFEVAPPLATWEAIAERLYDDKQYVVLSEKMKNFTVPPDAFMWDSVAERIYDDGRFNAVSVKMSNTETTPPANAWENISTRLFDDNLYSAVSTRFNNLEETPPPAIWKTVAGRLHDDEQHSHVSSKLNDFDIAPPSEIWRNVLSELNETEENQTLVINVRRLVYRISAAAAIVAFFVGSWVIISHNHTEKNVLVKNTKTNKTVLPPSIIINKENKQPADNSRADQKIDNNSVALQHNSTRNTHITKKSNNIASAEDNAINKYATVDESNHKLPASDVTAAPILDKNGNEIADIDVLTTSSNYIVIAGPNGQLTRISSKFANVIRFLNDDGNGGDTEEYLDKVIKESSTWKKRFQEWRNKISQSSYIPSSANFLDIAEFKDLIQEKK